MMTELQQVSWPLSQLGEAMIALAQWRGLIEEKDQTLRPPAHLLDATTNDVAALNEWAEAAADYVGLEAEPIDVSYAEVETMVCSASPMLLRLPNQQVLALLKGNTQTTAVLAPDLKVQRVKTAIICTALRQPHEAPLHEGLDKLLSNAKLSAARGQQTKQAILREQLSAKIIGGGWLLRLRPSASFLQQLRQANLLQAIFAPVAWHTTHYLLLLAAWWVLGRGALQGQLEPGWFIAWALLLCSAVPFHLLAVRAQGRVAIGAGALLKQRLLYGALRLDPEAIRHQGTGQLLGQVAEANAIETLALNGGFQVVVAGIELTMAFFVLGSSANRWVFVTLLFGYLAFVLLLAWRYWLRRKDWTNTRLTMTNDLVERMVGHRTRLAQEARDRWHEGEDQMLTRYLTQSQQLDRAEVWQVLAPGGWLVLSLCGLAFTFVSENMNATTLAITIGGVLLGFRGLQKFVQSLNSLLGAALSWQQIAGIFKAAESKQTIGAPDFAIRPVTQTKQAAPVVIAAHDLSYRYQARGNPVLRACSLQIHKGDRLLLQGASGGGKSTLASLLAGWRKPESGLLLVDGLDYETIGAAGWRKRVVAAPQFHENHIITGTFAFNVLLGRSWPPSQQDWQQAETICRALGLGELLERMPAGMLQMIGETGWQLSHGERSRVFLARALMQGAETVILDESFGALDPTTMQKSLQCALERVSTLCVIAHP